MQTTADNILIATPFGRFAAKAWGPKDGRPFMALHGWLDNAASFDFLGPRLGGVRLLALDLAGHGLSEYRPEGVPYHFVDYVRDIVAVAEEIGWERFGLLGHSLGAAIATLIAGAFPKRVSQLILIEGLGPLASASHELPTSLARSVSEQLEFSKKRKPVYTSSDEAARARQQASDISLSAACALVERGLKPCEGGFTWRSDHRLRATSPQRLSEQQVRAFLQRIEAPTLLILGEEGLGSRYMAIRERATLLRHLEIVSLPGLHHLHMDLAPAVAHVVNHFFRVHPVKS